MSRKCRKKRGWGFQHREGINFVIANYPVLPEKESPEIYDGKRSNGGTWRYIMRDTMLNNETQANMKGDFEWLKDDSDSGKNNGLRDSCK